MACRCVRSINQPVRISIIVNNHSHGLLLRDDLDLPLDLSAKVSHNHFSQRDGAYIWHLGRDEVRSLDEVVRCRGKLKPVVVLFF